MSSNHKTTISIILTPEEKELLQSWQRSTTICSGLAKRGRVILMLAADTPISHIARIVGISRKNIYKWIARFQKHRIDGLWDQPGRGRRPFFPSGGGNPLGQDGLRKTRRDRQIPFPIGLHGTIPSTR
jgi:hypothetical protein